MQMRQVPAHFINIVKSDYMQRRTPSDAPELVKAMQVADDDTFGSAPTRPLTLTPVLLIDEGRNFLRVAKDKLLWAGHSSSISPAGIWCPITVVVPLNVDHLCCCPGGGYGVGSPPCPNPVAQEGSNSNPGLPTLRTPKVTPLTRTLFISGT